MPAPISFPCYLGFTMNIFVLAESFQEIAEHHCNKHVVKMPLESAQMLCTNLWLQGVKVPYRPVSKNHPCTIWARSSQCNFIWLASLGEHLCHEYQYRYGKIHKCLDVIKYCRQFYHLFPDIGITEFAQAMPDYCRDANAVNAYRTYYIKEKWHLANWTKRDKPSWFNLDIAK
jgi:hypothetical protein